MLHKCSANLCLRHSSLSSPLSSFLLMPARFTSECTKRMNKLFDSRNSSILKEQNYKLWCAMIKCLEHHAFLEPWMNWITWWHFGSPQDKWPHTPLRVGCLQLAFLLLWTNLKDLNFTHFHSSIAPRSFQNLFTIICKKFGVMRHLMYTDSWLL